MAKRITVKYTGCGNYEGLTGVEVGTEFKAVKFQGDWDTSIEGAYIRGSTLAKATGNKEAFKHKQYLFIFGYSNSDMEIAHEV